MAYEPKAARIGWVDAAKAIGIILIVFGHANRSVSRTEGLDWSTALRFVDTALYAFHVPLFFVLAGIAAGLARSGTRNVIASVVVGIVVPYLIWSAIWIVAKASLPGEMVNRPLAYDEIAQILWAPVDHFWFLFYLAFIRIFWLGIEVTLSEAGHRMVLLCLIVLSVALRMLGTDWVTPAHALENATFFGVGLLFIASRNTDIQALHHLPLAIASTVMFAGAFWLNHVAGWSGLTLVTSLLGVCAVLFFLLECEKRMTVQTSRRLEFIGQASLVIFLVHGFAIGAARALLNHVNWLTPETLIVFGTLAGVVVPLIGYAVVRNLSMWTGKPILTWIGWGRWRAPGRVPETSP